MIGFPQSRKRAVRCRLLVLLRLDALDGKFADGDVIQGGLESGGIRLRQGLMRQGLIDTPERCAIFRTVRGFLSIFMLFALVSFGAASVMPPMPVKTCEQECCSDEGVCPCDPADCDCGAECCKMHNPPVPQLWLQPVFSPLSPDPGGANAPITRAGSRMEKPPLPPPRV